VAELTPLEELQKRIRDRALGVAAPERPAVAPPGQQSDEDFEASRAAEAKSGQLRDLQASIRARRFPPTEAKPEEMGLTEAVGNAVGRNVNAWQNAADTASVEAQQREARVKEDRAAREASGDLPLWERLLFAQIGAAAAETPEQLRAESGETLRGISERNVETARDYPMTQGAQDAQMNIMEAASEGGFRGLAAGVAEVVRNPIGSASLFGQVAAEQLPTVAAAAAMRNPQLAMSAFTMSGYSQERFGQLAEEAAKFGYDISDPEQALAAANDEELMARQEQRGATRGSIIAAVDLLTLGLASKAPVNARGLATQTGVQMAGGGGGEALAEFADTGTFDPGNVILEAGAEGLGASADVLALATGRKPPTTMDNVGGGRPPEQGTTPDAELALEDAMLGAQQEAEAAAEAAAQQQAAVVQDRAARETRLDYAPTFTSNADFIKQREAQLRTDVTTPGTEAATAYREFLVEREILPTNEQEVAAAINTFVKETKKSVPPEQMQAEYRAALDEHIAGVQALEAAVGVPQEPQASPVAQAAPVAEADAQTAPVAEVDATVEPAATVEAATVAPAPQVDAVAVAKQLVENTGIILDDVRAKNLEADINAIEALPVEERATAVRAVLSAYTSPQVAKTASTAPKVREYTAETPTRGRDDAKNKADALLPEGWIESADTRFEDVQGAVNATSFSKPKFDQAMAKALAEPQTEVAVQAQEELLAGTEVVTVPTPKGLTKTQKSVWDVVREAFLNSGQDTVIQPDGSWNFTKIQELAGLKSRQAAQQALKQLQPKIAKTYNLSAEGVKTQLSKTAESRRSAQPAEKLNDATEVFDKAELASNMGTVASVNQGAKTGVDAEDAAFTAARSEEPNVVAEKRAAEAIQTRKEIVADTIKRSGQAAIKAWANMRAEGGPKFASLSVQDQTDWVLAVDENLSGYSDDATLDADQREIASRYDAAVDPTEEITNESNTDGEAQSSETPKRRVEKAGPTPEEGRTAEPDRAARSGPDGGRAQAIVEDAEVVSETPAAPKEAASVAVEPAGVEGEVVGPEPDRGVRGAAKPPTVEVKKKKKIVAPPAPKFSVGEIEASMEGTDAGVVAGNVRQALGWLIGKDSDWRVTVVRNPNDMIGMVMAGEVDIDSSQLGDILDAKSPFGVVVKTRSGVTRAFFFAENIAPGTEHAVVMHEVGSHIGMDAILTKEQKNAAVKQIQDWSVMDGNSLEKRIAEKAVRRVNLAVDRDAIGGDTVTEIVDNLQAEYIAYFLEEAVLHGVTPTSDNASAVRDFVRGLWADFKRALRKLRPANIDAMTAQDFVNMARGAARLELGTRAHGGTHDFRVADPRFFGLGNNANGIGFYVSEEHNLAYDYMTKRAKERGVEEGTLLRVDVTVDDADMMVWGDTLENQPIALAAFEAMTPELQDSVLRENRVTTPQEMTGRQFYTGVAAAQIRNQLVENYISQADYDRAVKFERGNAKAMSMASSLLNDLGVKGIRTAVSNPTTLANPTFNNIIFDADNVVIVGRNDESDTTAQTTRSGTTRFGVNESSKQEAREFRDWTGDNLGTTAQRVVDDTKAIWDAGIDALKPISLFIRDHAKTLPALNDWYNGALAAKQTRRAYTNVVDEIANRARALAPERLALVNNFLSTSTFFQKWGYDPQIDNKTVKIDPIMKKKFDRLTAQEQRIVKDIFNQGEVLRADMNQIAKDMGIGKTFVLNSKLDGPYAPLKRFGDKVVILKSQALVDAEKAASANSADGNTKKVDELKSDPKHYVVQFFDTQGSANQFRDANKGSFAYASSSDKAPDTTSRLQNSTTVYQKVLAAINAEDSSALPTKSKQAAKKLVEDLLFRSLDERSARLSGARRMNIAGYDQNMIRSFVSHGRSQASLIAQMKHGGEINGALVNAQKQVSSAKDSDRGDLQRAYNVIAEKNSDLMTPRSGFLAELENQVLAFNTTMMLSTSLGYHVTNRLQPIYSVAKIASDFGKYPAVWAALFNGNKVARSVIDTSFMRQVGTVVSMGFVDMNNKVTVDTSKADPKYRGLLEEMQLRDLLDVGMEEDLNLDNRKDSGYKTINKLKEKYADLTHRLYQTARYVEASNRVSSAVAAFDMAQKSPAMLKKLEMTAQQYAINVVQDTQGDFSAEETSLLFSKLPRVTTQFRKYQIMMGFLHARALKQSFDPRMQPWERAAAKRLTGYLLATTGTLAGTIGLPAAGIAFDVFMMAFGDEDEPEDLERTIRDNIDDPQIATLVARGLPAMLGVDMSTKMSMNDIFQAWDSRYAAPSTDRDGMLAFIAQLGLGPTAGNIGSLVNSAAFMQEGNIPRAVEAALPKGGRTLMESWRLSNDGFTTRRGDVVAPPEEFNLFDLATNMAGIPSSDVANLKWTYYQQIEIDRWFSDRQSQIRTDYLRAYDDNDRAGMNEVIDRFRGLQDGKDNVRPFYNGDRTALRRTPTSSLRSAVRDRRKEERQLQTRAGTR